MPEHIHLLIYPKSDMPSVPSFLKGFKRPFSGRVKLEMEKAGDSFFRKLLVQERPGKQRFRFWQEGPGYDFNVSSPNKIEEKIKYIHENPIRRGLVNSIDEWKWSSWKKYDSSDGSLDPDLPNVRLYPW